MTTTTQPIPNRPSPGLQRAAPSAVYQGGSGKCATDIPENKTSARSNITTGTWNVRTLREAGKLEELTHEMKRDDKHQQIVGFLIHKNTVNCVIGCRPISSRLITIRLRATPFNITIIQAYAPTSDYDNVEDFYEQLQEVLDQTPKKHSSGARRREHQDRRRCLWKLERHM